MSSELFKIRKKEAIEKLINKAKEYELIALDENESFGKRHQAKLAAVMSLVQANQIRSATESCLEENIKPTDKIIHINQKRA